MRRSKKNVWVPAVLFVLAAAYYLMQDRPGGGPEPSRPEGGGSRGGAATESSSGESTILDAFERRMSETWVEASGTVTRTLPDDNEGSRHQKFIVELPSGHTVLLSHNIDLADRADGLGPGDRVAFRGMYEWNERGGVVHWLHHDPRGRHEGGWLEHGGRRYR